MHQNTFQETQEWEDQIKSSIDVDDFERGYIILRDLSNEIVEIILKFTGFTFIDYAIIDGEERTILSETDDKIWLEYESVDEYWDGEEWVNNLTNEE